MFEALQNAPFAAFLLSEEGQVLDCNRKALEGFGDLRACASGAYLAVDGQQFKEVLKQAKGCSAALPVGLRRGAERTTGKLWAARGKGGAHTVQFVLQEDSAREVMINLLVAEERNSKLRAEARRLSHLAQTDPLTGLLNRRGLSERLNPVLSGAAAKGCLLFLDLDGFKQVNDSLGHEVGDQVLQTAAARLRSVLRERDLPARLGGDEFVLWLNRASKADAASVAERIKAEFAKPVAAGTICVQNVHASIGWALAPDDGQSLDDLLKVADEQMYEQKQGGQRKERRA